MTENKHRGRPFGTQQYPGVLGRMRVGWDRMKAQAKYRGELFDLTWEQFQEIWEGHWHKKGRTVDSLCMTRRDWKGPWTAANIMLVDRREHFSLQGKYRVEQRRELKRIREAINAAHASNPAKNS